MSSEPSIQVRSEAWSGSDSRLARAVARPMVRFLAQETASGVMLLLATAAALVWVNLPGELGESYHHFWATHLDLTVGSWVVFDESLEHVVNDALMVLFFFVVGLEIKSELVVGDLREPRVAALPAIAALGGMIVPALIYTAVVTGGEGANGWGVPMATDIAFAVGVLALLGPIVPARLKLFLLTLAIVDDIGAILVIAVFYTSSIAFAWLGLAALLVVLVAVMTQSRIWYTPLYAVLGFGIWYATFQSGVHATIAGVVLGLVAPATPLLGPRVFESLEDVLAGENAKPDQVFDANWKIKETISVTTRLTGLLSPWTSFIIVPLFALANAGIEISGGALSGALGSRVTWGIVLGLVIGKTAGISLFTWAAVRWRIASLPAGVSMGHVVGGGAVAGIGFTVALFIAKLAFVDEAGVALPFQEEAILGILFASLIATMVGFVVLRVVASRSGRPGSGETGTLNLGAMVGDHTGS
ncbi:MAG: Na+/H+ antiporter NhaA [Actinomycetota bacterium]